MRKLVFGMLILVLAMVAGTTTAKAQTDVTLGVSNSGIIFSSNGNPAAPSNTATVNSVADSGHATSIGAATQTGTYAFELTRGPVRLTAPEPSSMLLFGSGFLLVGAVLRRRLRAPKAK